MNMDKRFNKKLKKKGISEQAYVDDMIKDIKKIMESYGHRL